MFILSGIGVSILYPPNTETEGFAEELRTMPEEVYPVIPRTNFNELFLDETNQ
jgi:hypothetical protein